MEKVAILYIATGRYTVFWPDFYKTARQLLLRECRVEYFVFTDVDSLLGEENGDVHRLPQEALPWPYSTLMRFAIFAPLLPRLESEGFTHAFFLNANYEFRAPVTAEEFLPRADKGEVLTLCRHPGYTEVKPPWLPYDRNPKSTAYIPYNKGSVYVCGGTNGGTLAGYGALIRTLEARVNEDLAHGVIARWHDESQVNRYALENPALFRLVDPAYCYPEGAQLPFPEIIRVRNKANWLDVEAVKGKKPQKGALAQKWENQCDRVLPALCAARDALLRR